MIIKSRSKVYEKRILSLDAYKNVEMAKGSPIDLLVIHLKAKLFKITI